MHVKVTLTERTMMDHNSGERMLGLCLVYGEGGSEHRRGCTSPCWWRVGGTASRWHVGVDDRVNGDHSILKHARDYGRSDKPGQSLDQ